MTAPAFPHYLTKLIIIQICGDKHRILYCVIWVCETTTVLIRTKEIKWIVFLLDWHRTRIVAAFYSANWHQTVITIACIIREKPILVYFWVGLLLCPKILLKPFHWNLQYQPSNASCLSRKKIKIKSTASRGMIIIFIHQNNSLFL